MRAAGKPKASLQHRVANALRRRAVEAFDLFQDCDPLDTGFVAALDVALGVSAIGVLA